MRFIQFSLLAVLAVFSFIPASYAQNDGPYVGIKLIPERGIIKPGEEIGIAIEQTIAPGWHTYWKNAGDSGVPPRITWTLPEGFGTSEIEWPVPRKIPYGPLLNYGYENSVTLLQKLKAPDTIPDGPLNFKAVVDVLVCHEICIPETGTYEITLNSTDSASFDNSVYFQKARAQLPQRVSSEAKFYEQDGTFILEKPVDWSQPVAKYEFIPEEWGAIENNAEPDITEADGKIIIKQKRGQRALSELKELRGLLLWHETINSPAMAYEFIAYPGTAPAAVQNPAQDGMATPPPPLFFILAFALLGGLILNLMPCVFPVLSIKALSLVQIAAKEPGKARLHGIAYTAGVILSFMLIASILIALKAGGSQIGWGFQLQSPEIVTLLAWLLFVVGLNLSGIFEISGHFGNFGNRLTQGNTPGHSFFTGILATLVATPCTAPFMVVAVGFALAQPAFISLMVFAVLGLGLALPYLLLALAPPLQKILPKPGGWMNTFKQLLAFPMYASAAWLVWVLSQQSGPMGVFAATMGIVLIAFGIWLLRHMPTSKIWHAIVRVLAILAFLAALMMIPSGTPKPEANITFAAWTPASLTQALDGQNPVFVEMTAAWCITCKVNHAVAINVASTRKVFEDNRVEYLVGDWTNQDPEITQYLNQFGRSGVPIYVYYGPRDTNGTRPEPVVLPQILTPGIVAKTVTGTN